MMAAVGWRPLTLAYTPSWSDAPSPVTEATGPVIWSSKGPTWLLSLTSRPVSAAATIWPVSASTPRCNFRQDRRVREPSFSRARGNFRTVVARGRMLPSVRPLVRQRTAAGLYGSSRTGSQITAAYSRYGVAHWLSRSPLADRCAMPSFRSPHALAAPARLRGRRRSPINAPLDQQGPDNAGRL